MKKPKFSELQILAELDFSIPLMQLRGSASRAPCHEVSVEPTLRDVPLIKKCRLFCSGMINSTGSCTYLSDQRMLADDSARAVFNQFQKILKPRIAPVVGIWHLELSSITLVRQA